MTVPASIPLEPEVGMPVEHVPTPALVVDLDRMERNLATWQDLCDRHDKHFRPHIKTHKIPAVGLQQAQLGACGIAAAKPSEAEVFARAGIDDIVVAFPTVGLDKWGRVARIARETTVAANVDSEHQVRGLSEAAIAAQVTIGAHIEIDTGLHRVGVAPEQYDDIAAFARLIIGLRGIKLKGVTTYRGKFGNRLATMTNEEAGYEEGQILADLAERLRADGIPISEVSAGGTITGRGVAQVPGVTEVRAGTYVFYDAMQESYGACTRDDIALSVLATVVSIRRSGWATVDAGSKTFSGDHAGVSRGSRRGNEVAPAVDIDAAVMRITEEHGMVQLGEGVNVEVGQKLRFTPCHVCTVVNLSRELLAVRNGVVEALRPVEARGCRT